MKKRGVGRWRLSEEGRRDTAAAAAAAAEVGGGFEDSPLRSNRNPFSPDGDGRGGGRGRGGGDNGLARSNQVCGCSSCQQALAWVGVLLRSIYLPR